MSGTARILLLADEPRDLAALKGLVAEAAPDRTVQTVTNTKEALAALEQEDFEVVFCDLVSGPVVGALFLQEVFNQRPRSVRFLLVR